MLHGNIVKEKISVGLTTKLQSIREQIELPWLMKNLAPTPAAGAGVYEYKVV